MERQRRCVPSRWHASVRMNLEVGGLMDRLPRTEKKSKKRKSAQSDNAGQSKLLFSERKSIRAHELGSRRFDGSFTAH
jgi:hypothetical protein